ncbi:DNA cytosine methyltransferase [Micromonospora arida]|uniref:DNA cytosine methyltransferase n=1 Tax=Micromonospora arida TaxID=2203715 RepID=UPI0033CDF21D
MPAQHRHRAIASFPQQPRQLLGGVGATRRGRQHLRSGAGITGTHSSLWSAVADAIRILRPPLVFVENVAALSRRGFDVAEDNLAAIGYDTRWLCLRAPDMAPPTAATGCSCFI